jgi:hypothetical protein
LADDPWRFEPVESAGKGATSEVWKARDRLTGGQVALKIARSHEGAAILDQLRAPREGGAGGGRRLVVQRLRVGGGAIAVSQSGLGDAQVASFDADLVPNGTGTITLDSGGELHILSNAPPGEIVGNAIFSSSGIIRADHNYTAAPGAPYAPGILHTLGAPAPGGTLTVDNPAFIGATNAASVTFTADNGYNFQMYSMTLANAGGAAPVGTRTVVVNNGDRRDLGYAGSLDRSGPNRLAEQVVTTFVGIPGGGGGAGPPSLFDFNPVTGAGMELIKGGTGVLAIRGTNTASSTGIKTVLAGVMRFVSAPTVSLATVALCAVCFSNSGSNARSTCLNAPAVSTWISAPVALRDAPTAISATAKVSVPILILVLRFWLMRCGIEICALSASLAPGDAGRSIMQDNADRTTPHAAAGGSLYLL